MRRYRGDGQWETPREIDRLESEAFRYQFEPSFATGFREYGFNALPPSEVGIYVDDRGGNRACWVALDNGKPSLDLVIICKPSSNRTELAFSPQVRYIYHNLGDHQIECWRVGDDPLFRPVLRFGKLTGRETTPSFLARIQEGGFNVSLREAGYNVELLTLLFEQFTGGNSSFKQIVGQFEPKPEEDVFLEMTEGAKQKLCCQWQQQLERFKAQLVPAI